MKASELIAALQAAIESEGDLDVHLWWDSDPRSPADHVLPWNYFELRTEEYRPVLVICEDRDKKEITG